MSSDPSDWTGGDLTISRTTSNVKEDYITLTVRSGGGRVDIECDMETFAQVLTGLGRQPVAVRRWAEREDQHHGD
jgi:hypothetical protein